MDLSSLGNNKPSFKSVKSPIPGKGSNHVTDQGRKTPVVAGKSAATVDVTRSKDLAKKPTGIKKVKQLVGPTSSRAKAGFASGSPSTQRPISSKAGAVGSQAGKEVPKPMGQGAV